ncbi:type I polyketide synthase [Amycolatopsis sp. GM8]|uniref:type I polyketide synthase n=1 Tax=Amycolatopsis sp. GM8 TaxID=2896530 RepID=UPI001F1EC618|nr:type I polyketide synthase [Amycolatopsis sp. GM8]
MTPENTVEGAGPEIAIVGMSGSFPGARDVGGLWANLLAGTEGISRFTEDELRAAGVSEELLADPAYVRAGAVLDDIDQFDAEFFGMPPAEARILDPQHRLFLEHTWRALEDAGRDPARFPGPIGVFGGTAWSAYLTNNLLTRPELVETMGELALGLANEKDSLTTRVSHTLGLSGPSYAVQSFCSTSLVAVAAAATSLAGAECDLALAGGVSVAVPHRVGYLYQDGGMTSPDGSCRAFDAAAQGTPVGSGVGVVALRRLEDALADGDRVYAVIRGWAVNNDAGHKVGFTAPGVRGQTDVVLEALGSAGLGPADIDYVEAHGTGTALGDAAELAALQEVFRGQHCLLGSVKTSVGHLDRAAGVTGLIKTALALHHETLPATLNFATPSEQLRYGDADLEVVGEQRNWPRSGRHRHAGVSAFGIGGTNAHVVLGEAPAAAARPTGTRRHEVLVWSGRSAAAADDTTTRLGTHLADADAGKFADTAYTLQTGRRVFEHRRVLVAPDAGNAVAALRGGEGVLAAEQSRHDRPVGWLIAGVGEQHRGMVAQLYRTEPYFRSVLDECREGLREHLGTDPVTPLVEPADTPAENGLARLLGRAGAGTTTPEFATQHSQPAVFAVEYALGRQLMAWGIRPAVMAGYSLGEYVAATLAGVLSLPDALALVAHRAKLIAGLPGGVMAAVPLAAGEVRERIRALGLGGLDIGAINGPGLTVVTGEPGDFAVLREALDAAEVPVRPLDTTHAFHSRMLAPIKAELASWIGAHIRLAPPEIPYVSNVTGELITAEQAVDPGYWAEHMCSPVDFSAAIGTILSNEDIALLELGPGQSLGSMVRTHPACDRARWPSIVPTLPGADGRPDDLTVAEALGRLWLAGVPVDWEEYQAGRGLSRSGAPGYGFQRKRYWVDPPAQAKPVAVPAPVPEAPAGPRLLRQQWRVAPGTGTARDAVVVLLADVGGVAERVRGERVVTVRRADSFSVRGTEFTLDPGDPDGYQALLSQLTVSHPGRELAFCLLWTLDEPGAGGVLEVGRLVAALDASGLDQTRVLVATRGAGAVRVSDETVPEQAAITPACLVARQEQSGLDIRTIDLDPLSTDPAQDASAVSREIGLAETAAAVAYRDGKRFLPDYVSAEAGGPALTRVRRGGTYLITGGLGDVGLLVAGHLADAGARRVVLTSRRGVDASPERAEAVRKLRESGVDVSAPPVDVTDLAAMRALVDGLVADGGTLDGVVHAAGETDLSALQPLRELTPELLGRQFAAKVDGARVLEEVLAGLPLERRPEFCLVFSSTSAVLGGVGFAPYAAANAALGALARQHAEAGDPTRWIAAAWDTWEPTVARLAGGFGASMAQYSMTAAESLAAFDRVLACPESFVLVLVGDVETRSAASTTPSVPRVTGGDRPDLPQPYLPPRTATERTLAGLWSELLGIERIGVADNFFDLGGSSLLGLQLVGSLKKKFDRAVSPVTLFEAPTVRALAEYLDDATPVRAQAPVRAVSSPTAEDTDGRIAIVGMAGRFPGAGDVAGLWRNLLEARETISFFTEDELVASGVSRDLARHPDYVPARPVLDEVRGFDAGFFGFSPRAATMTDPQQRLFLEVCWEAMEHAGYATPQGRGRVGVYGGCNLSTYLLSRYQHLRDEEQAGDHEVVMGNDKDALTTTVSYLFDLGGPSVAVQTFCSTSLVAVHLAVRSLRAGECEMALAGGVSVRVPDRVGHLYEPGGMGSPDGHVRAFDADAHGSMFGDGAAVVMLKPLAAALRDGDTVWAVVRGSAMNNDGALKVSYTAPSVAGQARVIEDAMADAGVSAGDVGFVEAHGTGTELGDPIEVAALTRAFGGGLAPGSCVLGSAKTNVGHLDRAAGVTGLIKAALTVRTGLIPPTLHFREPNPKIDFADGPFAVSPELVEWPSGRPRIAGVSSLGMGGTNVHVVVEAPPRAAVVTTDPAESRRMHMVPVSAASDAAVDETLGRLRAALEEPDAPRVADVAYTLQVGRKTFPHRRAVVSSGTGELTASLAGRPGAPAPLRRTDPMAGRRVAFVFAGAGEHHLGMVTELYRREPVFRAAFDECATELPGVDLVGLLAGARHPGGADPRADELRRPEVAEPAAFATEYALARTMQAWGVQPEIMLGYSLGEYVAACLADVFSLRDAMKLIAHRAALVAGQPGAALAVPLPVEELEERFGDLEGQVLDLAVHSGPRTVVVSGAEEAVAALADRLTGAQVACRRLETSHAFHSRSLTGPAAELPAWIRDNITLSPPSIPFISNVTGQPADAALVCDPGYWARQLRETVRFADGVNRLLADPELAVLEVGPGQSLGALVRGHDCPRERWPLIVATLPAANDRRADDEVLTDALARFWLCGVDLDWSAYHAGGSGRVPLPTYPFQRQEYWLPEPEPVVRERPEPGEPDGLFETITATPRLPEEEWLHVPVWRGKPAAARTRDAAGLWLVFRRDEAEDEALAKALADAGADIVTVRPGDEFGGDPGGGFTVRPGVREDTAALLARLRDEHRLPQRVLHLWTLTGAPGEHEEGRTVDLGLRTLVAFARAARENGLAGWSLDIVTSATQQVLGTERIRPEWATLAGPLRVIPLEYPDVRTRLIDLEVPEIMGGAAAVVAELLTSPDEQVVAVRGGQRWVPGYERVPAPPAGGHPLREEGVYLITGGLGGIGLAMAERLARDCRARLVLLGRSGLPPRDEWPAVLAGHSPQSRDRVAAVLALEELGAEVEIVAGDVSRDEDVQRAVDVAFSRFGALHGVLHAAGVPAIGLMQFKDPTELDPVLAPKIAGTQALARALRLGHPGEVPLDFLVLFSSITSITGGGPGQVDYCAANAFLDSYARQLSAPGRPVVAVGWGEWTWNAWERGLEGYDEALRDFFRANRAKFGITFDEGWRSLLRVLATGLPHAVVSTQDFTKIAELSRNFTVDTVSEPIAKPAAHAEAEPVHLHPRPSLSTPFEPPSAGTEEAIAGVWSRLLKIERIGARDDFFELGGHSLLATQLVARLARELSVTVPVTTLLERPTVRQLAEALTADSHT